MATGNSDMLCSQGHAGTVSMTMRQDPLAAAAELIVFLESLCKQPEAYLSYDGKCTASTVKTLAGSLVCTVGEISTWPSAINVIPGQHDANGVICDPGLSCKLEPAALNRMSGENPDDVPVSDEWSRT
ncbi:allantoate deiminase 1-like [Primulina tabacum]|uniref:allantoate deiminase 1-like n=1 Tax=Primulina tabacum TaxID=48773 RepID=UPI003F592A9C